jgi:hypothetical protein
MNFTSEAFAEAFEALHRVRVIAKADSDRLDWISKHPAEFLNAVLCEAPANVVAVAGAGGMWDVRAKVDQLRSGRRAG